MCMAAIVWQALQLHLYVDQQGSRQPGMCPPPPHILSYVYNLHYTQSFSSCQMYYCFTENMLELGLVTLRNLRTVRVHIFLFYKAAVTALRVWNFNGHGANNKRWLNRSCLPNFLFFVDFSLSCKDLIGLQVKLLAPVYVPRFPLAEVDPRRTQNTHPKCI